MTDLAIAFKATPTLALSEHRTLRFAMLFLLYVAQGLPIGLFQVAVPAWLAQNGASAGAIGAVLAMTLLPWTLKLFYCFLVDRYAFLAMGRRRPWVIVSQLGIVSGLLIMAFVNPAVAQIGLIAAFAFAVNVAASMQDVAVDGLAVDLLPDGRNCAGQWLLLRRSGDWNGAKRRHWRHAYRLSRIADCVAGACSDHLCHSHHHYNRARTARRAAPALDRMVPHCSAISTCIRAPLRPIIRNLFSAMCKRAKHSFFCQRCSQQARSREYSLAWGRFIRCGYWGGKRTCIAGG